MDSKKLLLLIDQLRLVYGKQEINMHQQYMYHRLTWNNVTFYMMVNKSKETLKVVFKDGFTLTTKDPLIVRTSEIESVQKLTLGVIGEYDNSSPEIVYTDVPLKDLTELSKIVQAELDCKDYINTNDNFNYLFCCKANPEWNEYVNIESRYSETGKTFNVYITNKEGLHINTLLNSSYDPETGMLYSNSWSYMTGMKAKIDKKIMGIPKLVIQNRISAMRDNLIIIKNIVNNTNPESVKCDDIISEMNSLIHTLRTIQNRQEFVD